MSEPFMWACTYLFTAWVGVAVGWWLAEHPADERDWSLPSLHRWVHERLGLRPPRANR